MILDDMIANKSLSADKRLIARNSLLLKHIHQVCLGFVFKKRNKFYVY
jgi:hypothetical protein